MQKVAVEFATSEASTEVMGFFDYYLASSI
jgi:hypothetical protein